LPRAAQVWLLCGESFIPEVLVQSQNFGNLHRVEEPMATSFAKNPAIQSPRRSLVP
jgi:hypothetical protein